MIQHETPLGRLSLLGSILLIVVGGLGVLITMVALIGLAVDGRFDWDRAGGSLVVLLVSAALLALGILLYRRVRR